MEKAGQHLIFKGCLVVLASVILLFLGIALQHWCTTAPLVCPRLAKNAEAYFEAQGRVLSFSYEAGHVRGGYMASLLYDYNSQTYYIGLFERDSLFHGRWRCCGGVVGFEAGQMTSYNYSDPEGNAILIFAGVMLPKEANGTPLPTAVSSTPAPLRARALLICSLSPVGGATSTAIPPCWMKTCSPSHKTTGAQ